MHSGQFALKAIKHPEVSARHRQVPTITEGALQWLACPAFCSICCRHSRHSEVAGAVPEQGRVTPVLFIRADEVINSSEEDIVSRVKEITGAAALWHTLPACMQVLSASSPVQARHACQGVCPRSYL